SRPSPARGEGELAHLSRRLCHWPELWQSNSISEVLEHDLNLHVTVQVLGVRLYAEDVRRERWPFSQLDDSGDEGHRDAQHRALGNRECMQLALAASLDPFEIVGPTKGTNAAREKTELPSAPPPRE